jgi:predicted naringenin-chalcone synthase
MTTGSPPSRRPSERIRSRIRSTVAEGLGLGDVGAWVIHPGGPEILDVVADKLGLSEEEVGPSRSVLHDFGNCSSATVLLILDRILSEGRLEGGEPVVMLGFGPGLTAYAALLRAA